MPISAPSLPATLLPLREAAARWAALSPKERAHKVLQLGQRFASKAEELVALVCEETQKSPVDAWFSDLIPNLDVFSYWADEGQRLLKPMPAPISAIKFPKKKGELRREPHGLVSLITPWNYPIALTLRTLVPALMAGNGVLLKGSEYTPRTTAALEALCAEVLGVGLVVAVNGGAEAGESVIDASDYVVFIGSVATGRKVALRAAEQLKGVSLELGGKDAALVAADCDFDRSVAGVFWGAFANSGQNCAAIERCYVEAPIKESFTNALTALALKHRTAPLTTEAQRAVVRRHLDDALARGAKVHGDLEAARRGEAALILTNLPEDALVATEETFGPLLALWSVPSLEEGMVRANASAFGLTTSIWTKDLAKAQMLSVRANSGVVSINNVACTAAMPFAPWSGRGLSGQGVTSSPLAFEALTRPKFVLVDQNKVPEVWWHPFDEGAVALARQTLDWMTSTGVATLTKSLGLLPAMKKRAQAQAAAIAEAILKGPRP